MSGTAESKIIQLLNRKSTREDTEHSVLLRVFTYISVALGIFVAGFYNELYAPMALGLGGITAGYIFSYYRREYTNWWSRVVLTFGMLGSGWYYITQMFFSGRYHIIILTEMLIVLQVMHSFDLPRRKDLVYSVLSAFMLICVGGVQSRSAWYGLFLAMFTVISLIMLAIYHYQEASWRAVVAGGAPRRLAPTVYALLGLLLIGAPLFFFLLPRFETHAFVGLPVSGQVQRALENYSGEIVYPGMENGQGMPPGAQGPGGIITLDEDTTVDDRSSYGEAYFGFSPTLDINARGRLSDRLIMRVRTSTSSYYRGLVFDKYTKKGWKLSDMKGTRITNKNNNVLIQLTPHKDINITNPAFVSEDVYQTYYIERDMPNIIYSALEPYELYFPLPEVVMDKNVSLRAAYILRKGTVYTVISKMPQLQLRYLELANSGCPEKLKNYCSTENIPPRISQYAREVTASSANNYVKVMSISQALVKIAKYDINAPMSPKGVDPIEYFLFGSKRGYCEHFASAFVLMARSIDIPARLVTGFAPGKFNVFTSMFEVRGTDAHAWAEVYFPSIGWVPFDPTPAGDLGPVGYDRVTPMSYLMNEYAKGLQEKLSSIASGFAQRFGATRAVLIVALCSAGGIICVVLMIAVIRKVTRRRPVMAIAAGLHDSNRAVAGIYRRVVTAGARKGLSVTDASVPCDLESWFPEELRAGFRALGDLYDRAIYSQHDISDDELDRARSNGEAVIAGIRNM